MKPTEPNDAKLMKITTKEKEFLLSQVQIVLSECQRLVSQLSSVQCEDEKCPDVNPEDDVSSVSSQQFESHDLLWDTSEDFPVYSTPTPSAFYTLVFNEESSDDEMNSDLENCQILTKSLAPKCSFVSKIETFISSNYPNNVFSQEKSNQMKQERLNELVFIDFQQMWNHVDDLFVQNVDSNESFTMTSPAPEIVYKSINFSKVNVRNLANIPKPTSYPIHGVSNDPDFYTKIVKTDYFDYYGNQRTFESNFKMKAPFGSLYGYQTNEGIVPVPITPVNGHVWSDHLHDWILHAVYPDECVPTPTRAPWTGTRSPTRPPSTRRGWPTSRSRGRK